jgi:hypothetical protein
MLNDRIVSSTPPVSICMEIASAAGLAWRELRERGPSWRLKADRSVALLKEDTRSVLTDLTRKLNEEAGPKGGR